MTLPEKIEPPEGYAFVVNSTGHVLTMPANQVEVFENVARTVDVYPAGSRPEADGLELERQRLEALVVDRDREIARLRKLVEAKSDVATALHDGLCKAEEEIERLKVNQLGTANALSGAEARAVKAEEERDMQKASCLGALSRERNLISIRDELQVRLEAHAWTIGKIRERVAAGLDGDHTAFYEEINRLCLSVEQVHGVSGPDAEAVAAAKANQDDPARVATGVVDAAGNAQMDTPASLTGSVPAPTDKGDPFTGGYCPTCGDYHPRDNRHQPGAEGVAPSPETSTDDGRDKLANESVADEFLAEVGRELERACAKWPATHSPHEGYAVIKEELDEFWEEVRKKQTEYDPSKMRDELVQIAAMAARTYVDAVHGTEQSDSGAKSSGPPESSAVVSDTQTPDPLTVECPKDDTHE